MLRSVQIYVYKKISKCFLFLLKLYYVVYLYVKSLSHQADSLLISLFFCFFTYVIESLFLFYFFFLKKNPFFFFFYLRLKNEI